MATTSSAPLFAALTHAVMARQALIPGPQRPLVLELCHEAVTSAWELAVESLDGQAGPRAEAAAALLLDLTCPELRSDVRADLAGACARIATEQRWVLPS
ncbi:MAG: hypothetical protein ACTHNS_07250 [Marmoricola sp.]